MAEITLHFFLIHVFKKRKVFKCDKKSDLRQEIIRMFIMLIIVIRLLPYLVCRLMRKYSKVNKIGLFFKYKLKQNTAAYHHYLNL